MTLGKKVENYVSPPHPKGINLEGQRVRLMPLCAKVHAEELFEANALDVDAKNWTYLPYGPFVNLNSYTQWLKTIENKDDPVFFAIINKQLNQAVGIASFLRIFPEHGSIEVGHINYSPLLQNTTEATETMYLMMKWVFEQGYRRYEWKCNALNLKSRNAAQRLGFSYEGIFRQMTIQKGRNRDTAWFAIIDQEWQVIKSCFLKYLSQDNYDKNNKPIQSLTKLTRPHLFKIDERISHC